MYHSHEMGVLKVLKREMLARRLRTSVLLCRSSSNMRHLKALEISKGEHNMILDECRLLIFRLYYSTP